MNSKLIRPLTNKEKEGETIRAARSCSINVDYNNFGFISLLLCTARLGNIERLVQQQTDFFFYKKKKCFIDEYNLPFIIIENGFV